MTHLADSFESQETAPGVLNLNGCRVSIHGRFELVQAPPGQHFLLTDLLHQVETKTALTSPLVDLNQSHCLVPRHRRAVGAQLPPRIPLQFEQDSLDELLALRLAGRSERGAAVAVAVDEERQRRVDLLGRQFQLGQRRPHKRRLVEIKGGQFVLEFDHSTENGPYDGADVPTLLDMQHTTVADIQLSGDDNVAQVDETQPRKEDMSMLFRQGSNNGFLLVPQRFQLVLGPAPQFVQVRPVIDRKSSVTFTIQFVAVSTL